MFGLPTLFASLVGSDTQSEALLSEENISAVTGVNGDDGVILRELADLSLFCVNIAAAVESANPVVAVAENIKNIEADSCHDAHIENNID